MNEAPLGLHSLPGQFDPVGLEPQTPSSHRFATRKNNCYSHYIVYHPRVQGRNPGRLQGVRGVQRGPRGRIETPPGPSGLSGARNLLRFVQSSELWDYAPAPGDGALQRGHSFRRICDAKPAQGWGWGPPQPEEQEKYNNYADAWHRLSWYQKNTVYQPCARGE